MALSAATRPRSHRRLPEGSLIAGYAVDCDANVMEAVEAGANVVIWFASNLGKNATTGAPVVQMGLNTTCIAEMAKAMRAKKLEVAHLISIGGWNAPHPDTTFTGHEWFAAWDAWNKNHVAHTALGFDGFDGFDWDLEGNDKPACEVAVEPLHASLHRRRWDHEPAREAGTPLQYLSSFNLHPLIFSTACRRLPAFVFNRSSRLATSCPWCHRSPTLMSRPARSIST